MASIITRIPKFNLGSLRCATGGARTGLVLCQSFEHTRGIGSCRRFTSNRRYNENPKTYRFPKLSRQEVNDMLRENEIHYRFETGSIQSCDSNHLASNSPIEDRRLEAKCTLTSGMIFGIVDGHGGHYCSDFISKTIPYYIALSLLPSEILTEYLATNGMGIVEFLTHPPEMCEYARNFLKHNLKQYAYHLFTSRSCDSVFSVGDIIANAFDAVDSDISKMALHGDDGKPNAEMMAVALSGCCACIAHVDGLYLQVANVGDCKAVLGSLTEDNEWKATSLTKDHNSDNLDELKRVMNDHPASEANTVIKQERLLGQLMPLRALGDFMYKWGKNTLTHTVAPRAGAHFIPPNYLTPPYLISKPEVFDYKLTSRDKFLIIASDGLWEFMSPDQVVESVGKYMSGLQTLDPLKLPNRKITMKEINNLLSQRKEGLSQKPVDTNAATHLIRMALGGTEYGIDHGRLSTLLSIPQAFVRSVRDDISVTVIFFESNYFRNIKIES